MSSEIIDLQATADELGEPVDIQTAFEETEPLPEVEAPKRFQPAKFTAKSPVAEQLQTAEAAPETDETVTISRIKALEATFKQLIAGRDGVKVKAAPALKEIDFSKVREEDIFDLPIEAITHDLPDYINVTLKDTHCVPRWVNKNPRRLGPMRAVGWSYVEPQDLEVPLTLASPLDESGHYTLDDVVLMKCSKVIYFGQLKRNLVEAKNRINPKEAHRRAKQGVIGDLKSAGTQDYDKYASTGKLDVYAPGFEI